MYAGAHAGQSDLLNFLLGPDAPREIRLVHGDDAEAKFWLSDEVTVARNDGFDARTIRVLLGVVEQNKQLLEEARHGFELSVHGIHWEILDEDISVKGLLVGLSDQTRRNKKRAA